MRKSPGLLFVFTFLCYSLQAQVFPKENSKLHYVLIGFRFEAVDNAQTYRLEIAKGNHNSAESFKKNVVLSKESTENKVIAEAPAFGSQYTWRVLYKKNGTFTPGTELHHFSTLLIDEVDSAKVHLKILKRAEKYKDAYVFADATRTLYNMNGRPVWFLPPASELNIVSRQVRDMKITPQGTITFVVAGNSAYEVNYEGEILWKAPRKAIMNDDSTERYNHELNRLDNGHYIVSGSEFVWSDPDAPRPVPGQPMPPPKPGELPKPMNRPLAFGTIMEFSHDTLVWSWRSAQYFQHSDFTNYPFRLSGPMDDVHQNSFFFDQANNVIYVSYKNIHRIVKVKYPEGTVTNVYGEIYRSDMPARGNGMFCFQHSCKLSQKGYLYLFNNNSCNADRAPEIVMLKEPTAKNDTVKIIWKYEFPVEPLIEKTKRVRPEMAQHRTNGQETIGGNVVELPDQSLFASLCVPYSDLFIITPDKKVLWHAVLEEWKADKKIWSENGLYRASIIPGRKEMEALVWHSEK
jgi:hypothetical protein